MEAQKDAGLKDKYERTARPGTKSAAKEGDDEAEQLKKFQPRTRTALKLRTTCPPAVGRPKLIIGLKRENSSI